MSPTTFSGSSGGVVIISGAWRSQTLDVSLAEFRSDAGVTGYWGQLSFRYEGGDAYSTVKVDILDTSNAILASDINLFERDGYKIGDLSTIPAARSVDIRIQIRLQAVTTSGSVSDVTIEFQETRTR